MRLCRRVLATRGLSCLEAMTNTKRVEKCRQISEVQWLIFSRFLSDDKPAQEDRQLIELHLLEPLFDRSTVQECRQML